MPILIHRECGDSVSLLHLSGRNGEIWAFEMTQKERCRDIIASAQQRAGFGRS